MLTQYIPQECARTVANHVANLMVQGIPLVTAMTITSRDLGLRDYFQVWDVIRPAFQEASRFKTDVDLDNADLVRRAA